MYVIHKSNIIHGNLKSSNIMVDKTNVRISDIPFFKINKNNLQHFLNQSSAPEVFFGATPNKKSDIWSIGYILLEMYIGNTVI